MTESTTLYRFFDAQDRLLYIGIAGNPGRRFHQHAQEKPWWPQVTRSTMEHHPTREAALVAEKAAIQTEHPLWNVVHNGDRPVPEAELTDYDWSTWTCGDPECFRSGPIYSTTRHGRCWHTKDLYLMPELHCSPCIDDVYGRSDDPAEQGQIEVAYWLDYLRRKNSGVLPERVHIYWSIVGDDWHETAPLGALWGNQFPDLGDFLTHFSWPIDARTDSHVNFLRLPIRHRFPRFAAALGWQPAPLQRWCPIALLADPFEAYRRGPMPVRRAS